MGEKNCALICAYNEESTIGEVIDNTKKYVDEIVVVDDGSTDKTNEIVRGKGVILETHPKNCGKGVALSNGLWQFFNKGYDNLVTLDADLQHDPKCIPYFIKKLSEGYDMVIGKRNFSHPCVPRARKLGNTLDSKILSMILGADIPDPQNGFRAYTRNAARESREGRKSQGFTFELETLIQAVRQGKNIGWQEIPTIYIEGRESKIKPVKHVFDSIELYWKCLVRNI